MPTKTILITGSNRGIGTGITQLLASTSHTPSLNILATSRSGIHLAIQPSHNSTIHYAKLDISSRASIAAFLHSHPARIDVLINNAGVNNNIGETPDSAAHTVKVNYCGTRDLCSALLERGGLWRVVNVSSAACQLSNYAPRVQEKFRNARSVADVDRLADSYIGAVCRGKQEELGWGKGVMSYQVSKALVNALTAVLAQQNPDVLVNCCCPGWVDTHMGGLVGGKPPKTVEEGARIPVRLAVGELGRGGDGDGGLGREETERVSGVYFANDGVVETGWGSVRGW
ncbi:NAD(P)-binding protein [Ophiobolus disseminans]|uniref:NAD(P)-binding protein n=1 Tax=Ophiobolus disseminans TaxID=1469910 RepID=A0A6A6ZQN9_9PLEO|nr:NAD(P)-binding protein [Ophiobolus disseminans]